MITVTLITVSWACNAVRGGSLIVFIHDIADVLLEAGKCAKYAKCEKLCSAIFVSFIAVWIVTRLGIFSRIVQCGVFEFPTIYPRYPLYYLIACLTILLLVLHVLWTFMIFQTAIRMFKTNSVDDVRSSSESNLSDHDNSQKTTNGFKNVHNSH